MWPTLQSEVQNCDKENLSQLCSLHNPSLKHRTQYNGCLKLSIAMFGAIIFLAPFYWFFFFFCNYLKQMNKYFDLTYMSNQRKLPFQLIDAAVANYQLFYIYAI